MTLLVSVHEKKALFLYFLCLWDAIERLSTQPDISCLLSIFLANEVKKLQGRHRSSKSLSMPSSFIN